MNRPRATRTRAPRDTPSGGVRSLYLPPWRIDVTKRADVRIPVASSGLAQAVARALSVAGAPQPASVGLIFSNDAELAELNERAMGRPEPTDVLSFPLLPPEEYRTHPAPTRRAGLPTRARFPLPPRQRLHLGDIVISVERAAEQAESGHGGQTGNVRWSLANEVRLLAIHGALHLCGWDHGEPREEAAMRALEQRLLARIADPVPSAFDEVDPGLWDVMEIARREAVTLNHSWIGTEHLLLALVADPRGAVSRVLFMSGVAPDTAREHVESAIGRGDRPVDGDVTLTPRTKRIVNLSLAEARRLGHDRVGPEHLFLGLLREGEGIAAQILESLGADLEKLRDETFGVLSQPDGSAPAEDGQAEK
jgi:rRNA maturation RNase YbeY